MNYRFLTILNSLGCLVLVAVVVVQWRREQSLEGDLGRTRAVAAQREQDLSAEKSRADGLARDVGLLKESVASQQQALEQAQADLAKRDTEATALQAEVTQLTPQLDGAAKRVAEWQTSLAARDRRIGELETALKEARARLDQAIAKLKQAGAR